MKVVCVDDSFAKESDTGIQSSEYAFPNGWVKNGEVYTVKSVYPNGYILIEKPVYHPCSLAGWRPHRFVPLTYYEAEFQVSEAVERTAQHEINATSGGEVGIAQIAE